MQKKVGIPLNFKAFKSYPGGFSGFGEGKSNLLVLSENDNIYDVISGYEEDDHRKRKLLVNKLDINNIVYIERGLKTEFFVDNDGNLYVRGNNKNGQLGLGDNEDRKDITLNPNIKVDL